MPADAATLQPLAYTPLPVGDITPMGWLANQLRIQADGLTGSLDEFWPSVSQSSWIGKGGDAWERGPYWLDGLIPLAFLLDDERLKAKARFWIEEIVARQHADGWLGEVGAQDAEYRYDPWPRFVALKCMIQYHQATGEQRVLGSMSRFCDFLLKRLPGDPLISWAQMRWGDLLYCVQWLFDTTGEAKYLDLARLAARSGFDWRRLYGGFYCKQRDGVWRMDNHVVNHAMAIKQPALWYRLTGDPGDRQASYQMMETLDRYHGQCSGVFSGDESLAGRNPSQGTELCAVVEYMFSLEQLLATLGEAAHGDRLERIAFNALPAAFKPDMWAHQYDQQANQARCIDGGEDRVYTNNHGDANLFGLEPHYGCCLANMHQGWPKFATHLWMAAPDGLAAAAWAPCRVRAVVGGTPVRVEVETDYPFRDEIALTVAPEHTAAFALHLRVPGWAVEPTLTMDGETRPLTPGRFHRLEREWRGETRLSLRFPMRARTQTRYNDSCAIERGPLVYSLRVGEEWRKVKGDEPHADWEVHPTSPWNVALHINRDNPELTFEEHPVGDVPFSPDGAPVRAAVQGKVLADWTLERNAAAPPPQSPVECDAPLETFELLPYGCANLRMTELPTLEE